MLFLMSIPCLVCPDAQIVAPGLGTTRLMLL
jgi:hypothetical protein